MKILILGKNGQVGWELQRALAPLGELIALDRSGLNELSGDVSKPESITETILTLRPDVVVNASAYTAVDQAESDQVLADIVNHLSVKAMAEACLSIDALLVHYSTDYVFSGQGSVAFKETDETDPINVYGQTKALGEQAIIASQCKHLIFRTSWVYASHGKNFLKTMLNLAKQRDTLSVIDDQIGAPTSAALIADVTAHAVVQTRLDQTKTGLYHLVASGETSWHGYAQYIFEQAKQEGIELLIRQVNAIPTSQYPTPAKRPHNSKLNTQKLQQAFQLNLPDWQQGVKRTLMELNNK